MCLQKVLLAMSLAVWSSWNKQFCSVSSISLTHICQWRWRVFPPCSSSAARKANTVPNIPFPFEVFFLMSQRSMHSTTICITLWNSREHAPGFFSLMSFCKTKSAIQSASEHCNEARLCWNNYLKEYEKYMLVKIWHSSGCPCKLFKSWIIFIGVRNKYCDIVEDLRAN